MHKRGVGIGRRIAHYRKAVGISAETLASSAGEGLTRSVIANLENGRKNDLTVNQLLAIAETLQVPVSALLTGEDILRANYENVSRNWTVLVGEVESYATALFWLAKTADEALELSSEDVLWLDSEMPWQTPASSSIRAEATIETLVRTTAVEPGPYLQLLRDAVSADLQAYRTAERTKRAGESMREEGQSDGEHPETPER